MLVDTHCHLYQEYFSDIDKVISEAKDNDVLKYISAADDLKSAKEMLELASRYQDVYIALGFHPDKVQENFDELESILWGNKGNKKIVAIGEIGLDYYHIKENKEEQKDLFCKQLKLAERMNLPVVIHSREATKDTLDCLKKYKITGVIHCFNGSLETAQEYIKMGYKLGVNGLITFKNCKLKEVIKRIGLENLVLETDAPYLTPEPFRKFSNKPKYIKVIAQFLADLFDISLEEVEKITTKNALDIFDIK